MRYHVDFSEGKAGPRWRGGVDWVKVLDILSSGLALGIMGALVAAGLGYFLVLQPLNGVSSPSKEKLKELELTRAGIVKEKDMLLEEARVLLALQNESPGWAQLLDLLARSVRDGIWITRVALEEEKAPPSRPTQAQAAHQASKVSLVIQGKVSARIHTSSLEPIGQLLSALKGDPNVGPITKKLELSWVQTTKEDPSIVGFELKGSWEPHLWKGRPEDRIQREMERHGVK